MTENGGSRLDAETLFDIFGEVAHAADALGDHDDKVLFAGLLGVDDTGDDVALDVEFHFGNQDRGRAGGDTGLQGDVAAASAHYLHDGAAVVGLRGVADAVNHLQRGVHGGVKADGVFGAGDIVVDGARNADAVDAVCRQRSGAAEGTVAADDDHAADAEAAAIFSRTRLTLGGLEFLASGGVEHGAAVADNIRYGTKVHFLDFAVEQAVIAAIHAENAHTSVDAGANDRSEGRVHTGCVAAAGQYRNTFLFRHIITSMDYFVNRSR